MSAATVAGYRLTLPSGWYRIPTGADAEEACGRLIDAVARGYSDSDAVLVRRRWSQRLPGLVAEAEQAGALDLYVFAQRLRGRLVGMQFTVSVVHLGATVEWDRETLVEVAVPTGATHEFLDADAGEVLRVTERFARTVSQVEQDVIRAVGSDGDEEPDAVPDSREDEARRAIAAAESRGDSVPFTRLTHLVALPDAAGSFLLLTTEMADGPLSAVEFAHIDLIASTLAWVR